MSPLAVAPSLAGRLSRLDRFLPVWILAAMATGLLLGRFVPGLSGVVGAVSIGQVSLPIALGLLVMMYPVLAKVRYTQLGEVVADRRLMGLSLVLNWVLGPAVMFTLAWVFLPDLPAYRAGLVVVGLARCIAMVLVWNDLACGDREAAAVLVAVNSLFQLVAFAELGWFYLQVLPGWLGLPTSGVSFSVAAVAGSVLVFLGIPLAAGYATRTIGERTRGRDWYEGTFLPRLGPWALYGLLFTIVVLFALQGEAITSRPWDVARIAFPLVAYFAVMFTLAGADGPRGRLGLCPHHDGGVHRRREQLRARHRRRHRHLGAEEWAGPRQGRRPAHRGPSSGWPRLRRSVCRAPPVPRRPHPASHHPARHQQERPMTTDPVVRPSDLFVCVHNAGRSQMAAASPPTPFRPPTSYADLGATDHVNPHER